MILENAAPASAAVTSPLSVDDAAARITEYLAEYPTGLIACRFASLEQFTAGARQSGWTIERAEVLMKSELAETGAFQMVLKKTRIVGYWVSFGDSIQIVNCDNKTGDNLPVPETPISPPKRPWEK